MIPKIQAMETPKTRAEFELRLHKLRAALVSGKMHIPSDMGESLLKLRLLPNRRLDFLSVDEMVRLQANMMTQIFDVASMMEDRKDHDSVADE